MIIFEYIRINYCQTKLRAYCLFKKQFMHPQNYILMCRRSITANFSRLRLSAHSLMIEKGRHFRNNIPIENRLCTLCNLNETENEAHFMLWSRIYLFIDPCLDVLTTLILGRRCFLISDIYADFDNLDDNDKFILLMGVKDYNCILPIINFIYKEALANKHWIEIVKKSGPVGELNPGPLDVWSRTLPLRHMGSQRSHG